MKQKSSDLGPYSVCNIYCVEGDRHRYLFGGAFRDANAAAGWAQANPAPQTSDGYRFDERTLSHHAWVCGHLAVWGDGGDSDAVLLFDCSDKDPMLPSLTNSAPQVIEELGRLVLLDGRTIYYRDSGGDRDKLCVRGRRFAGYRPARPEWLQ